LVTILVLEDFSEEEARHALYEAKKQNRYTEGVHIFQFLIVFVSYFIIDLLLII